MSNGGTGRWFKIIIKSEIRVYDLTGFAIILVGRDLELLNDNKWSLNGFFYSVKCSIFIILRFCRLSLFT